MKILLNRIGLKHYKFNCCCSILRNYQRVEDLRRALKDVLEYFVITEILDYPDENYNLMCKFRKDLINCLNNMLSTEETLETEL